MKNKIKKLLSITLIACLLLTLAPLNATEPLENSESTSSEELLETEKLDTLKDLEQTEAANASEIENSESTISDEDILEKIDSSSIVEEETIEEDALTIIDNEQETEEQKNDNWELKLNFANKNGIINNKNYEWDATNGSYLQSEEKEIVLQVNYSNKDIQHVYNPGDITIKVKNLMYGAEKSGILYDIIMSANTSSQTGYKWNYISNEKFNDAEFFEFTNTEAFVSNTEGSFQIRYLIKFDGDNGKENIYHEMKYYPEKFEENCFKEFHSSSYGVLNDYIQTDDIHVNLQRTYEHLWEYQKFTINETPNECPNIPRDIVDNVNDYIWIAYKYHIPEKNFEENIKKWEYDSTYPYYRNIKWKIKTEFEDCIVFDQNYNLIETNEIEQDNFNIISPLGEISDIYLYVGYPKNIYNEENNNYIVNNSVDLYVEHEHIGWIHHDTDKETINLGDFKLNYDGNGYEINIGMNYHNSSQQYYECMSTHSDYLGGARSTWWKCPISVKVTDQETDVIIGLDTIFITGIDGEYRQLKDDEYYLKYFNFPYTIYDGFGRQIPYDMYDVELYIREQGSKTYKLYDTFKNPSSIKAYGLETGRKEKIVGYYFKIKGLKNGITTDTQWLDLYNNFTFTIDIDNAKISKQGSFYPFNYLKVYDKYGNLINNKRLDDYEKLSKTLLAPLDLKTHGCYVQRACDKASYMSFETIVPNIQLSTKKNMKITYQDKGNEVFKGKADIHLTKGDTCKYYDGLMNHLSLISDDKKLKGFEIYDLLPYGMSIDSSEEEIKNSLIGPTNNFHIAYNDIPVYSVTQQLKDACNIEIIENWKNTGRTWLHIKIDLGDNTIVLNPYNQTEIDYLSLEYNFSITYESYMENSTYKNDLYATYYRNIFNLKNTVKDDGSTDKDSIDINTNGNIDEKLSHAMATLNIDAIVACQQDVKKLISTDKNNFTTNTAESSLDSEYQYKILITTGPTDITNFVIYDNIEEAYSGNKYFKGNFLGIDTSYAESKGYDVKVYYSEDEKAGRLDNDTSWKEYSEDMDKTKVKSLAFKYLDKEGNNAILKKDTMQYVILKMKSPNIFLHDKTYNKATTQWNAIDEYGNIIDDIDGLDSNIVNIKLDQSNYKKVNLHFNKIIYGENEEFEKIKLDRNDSYNFFITLENKETGDTFNGLVNNKDGFTVKNIPIGTYIIKEIDDIWFKFVNMALNESIEGIEFKEESGNYILIINTSVEAGTTANIDITNKTDEEKFYDNKYDVKNLFNK